MSDYLDGVLAPTGRARMEHHIGDCDECRCLLADLRRILEGLHRLSASNAGVDGLKVAASIRALLSEPE